jgi:hypothetical protein
MLMHAEPEPDTRQHLCKTIEMLPFGILFQILFQRAAPLSLFLQHF